MTHIAFRRTGAICAAFLFVGAVQAAPVTFNFTYSGTATPPPASVSAATNPIYPKATTAVASAATITGSITFESTLLANPGNNQINLPSPAVLALTVTVSGTSTGNGTFGISDFVSVAFDTHGGTLDFSKQLVGQPTSGAPWGTAYNGSAGDFNLFGTGSAPVGGNYFTLCASGGGGCASLTSAINAAAATTTAPTPALDRWALLALAGLLGMAGFAGLRRYRGSH